MAWDFHQIQQNNNLSCDQKLDEIQDLIENIEHPPPGSLHCVSDIFEDCVNQEHAKCLNTAYLISKEVNGIAQTDIRRGLEAIGQADINAVNQFIDQRIQGQDLRKAHYLATIVPYLYRGQANKIAQQMQNWYNTYCYFFFRAIENTLRCFLEESSDHGATDFSSEIQPIKDKLEDVAQLEGLDPNNAYQDKNYEIVKLSILLNDLEWVTKNTVNWSNVQSNLSQYPHLEALLNHNNSAVSSLKQHNTHPLAKLLRHSLSLSQVNAVADNPDATEDEKREAKKSLGKIQKLTYYDYCIELITPGNGQNSDPNGRLRDELLARKSFDSTIAEIEVFNTLRREFGVNNVAIEQQAPNGGVPDAKITAGGEIIWIEVTLPQPQPSYQVARHYSASMNPEESDARANVTKKLSSQIREVKEATDDRTMLVIKNEESRVDHEIVKDYVEGYTGIGIPQDGPDTDKIILTADSGLQYDNVPDHLDILVNYGTLNDFSDSPYIEGQVANLTNVDETIIDQLVDAFNADELTPR